jgi:hypothetical protein
MAGIAENAQLAIIAPHKTMIFFMANPFHGGIA